MVRQAHPHIHIRGLRGMVVEPNPVLVRVLVHAPAPTRATWIEAELNHRSIVVQLGFSISQVLSALIEDPPPRPQLLVADFDELAAGAVMDLHMLREQGWFGRIIALGHVSTSLRTSLMIDQVVGAPFTRGTLRQIVTPSAVPVAATAKMPVL